MDGMSRMIRYGIIGCGGISPWHARGVEVHNNATMAAVCDLVPERAGQFAQEHGGTPYSDYNRMFDEAELDAVSICTPGGNHLPLVIAAAEHGVSALVEKPLDVSKEAMDEMVKVCAERGVKLAGVFQLRTTPVCKAVQEIVTSGKLGRMILADAYLKYYRTPEYYKSASWRGTYAMDGGGCLMNQGIHCVDQLLWCMGPVTSVFAHADHLVHDIEVEDTAVCVMKYANGAFGVIEGATSTYPGLKYRMEFHGDCGTLRVDGHHIVQFESSLVSPEEAEKFITTAVNVPNESQRDPLALGIDNHVDQVHDFINAILEDREPLVSGVEARKAVDLILAIYESARTGRQITL